MASTKEFTSEAEATLREAMSKAKDPVPVQVELASVLSAPHDGPTILAMHHPPFRTGISWMDVNGFVGLDRLADVLAEHPNVDRILCGHLHRPITTTVGGVTTQTCPTTSQPVALDLRPGQTISMITEPAAYNLHLRTEGGWVTHTRFVGLGVDPIVPDWAI